MINLQYPSPVDQTEANVRNWVNQYCEVSNKAPSELAFRNIVHVLLDQQEFVNAFMKSINWLDHNQIIATLKSMILIHRQMLYCSKVNPTPYETFFNRQL